MLNFAEQTGSGAVIVVWSFLPSMHILQIYIPKQQHQHKHKIKSLIFLILLFYNLNRTYVLTHQSAYIHTEQNTHTYTFTYLPTWYFIHSKYYGWLTCKENYAQCPIQLGSFNLMRLYIPSIHYRMWARRV